MAISTETYGGVAVTRLEDELTQDNVSHFETVTEQLLTDGIQHLVIDMERTEYLDNAGLEAIDDLMARLEQRGGQVKFSGLGTTCRKIFEITRLDRRSDIFESLIDAVRSFH